MSEVKWTNEQLQAINEKGSNILVAAAAGSGKTAVLVERIINKVINDKVDIDKILIVTFTSAAASEMRERILEAIYKKIEEESENEDLQRQIVLLNKSNISTIHSFCLDVIRNNFYEIDASANFRVADTAEIELLKQEIIDDLFEEKYISEDKEFNKLLDTYTTYRGDENLRELILNIYRFIQSCPFPERWLEQQVQKFNLKDKIERDFSETIWGQIILENFKEEITDSILKLNQVEQNLSKYDELQKYKVVISDDIKALELIMQNADSWEKAYESALTISWAKWPTDRKITLEAKDEAKEVRDSIKKKVTSTIEKYLIYNSKQANSDIYEMYSILDAIKNLVIEFTHKFAAKKKEKNIVDFNDIEHFALRILLKEDENGQIYETDVAKKYKEKFEEIAIDEYQDSNLVQEYILKSVSKGNNIFMVGDIKQSIYKFRQARPQLFLEKYATYKLKNEINPNDEYKGLKIQLFKNFRSRPNVLDLTNIVFENIMSLKLGDIDYNEKEFLNYGANYPEPEELQKNENNTQYAGTAELHIIDVKEEEDNIYKDEISGAEDANDTDSQGEEPQERIEDIVLEAKYVAKQIKELVESNYIVYDRKKGYRKITYKDIVVLLRSTKLSAPIFEKEISNLNMPVFSDVSSEYLESFEIQTIMSLLKVIDNPMQDIPLVTVLRSSIAGFTDNELVEIRGKDKDIPFYESLLNSKETLDQNLKNKVSLFIKNLKKWQNQEKYMSLDELIWQIYSDTNFYNYVTLLPNGGLRQANLKMLFERAKQYESASFKGLFNFINFIDKLHSSSGDLSSAKLIGENENVIRIMSIHKSKGLEFSVVFLSCTGKQFNMQDLNDSIILHQDLGFGPKYINSDMKIEYTTLAKEAIRLQAKVETMSEEMRVLYVALTRAKEKLIITGISKDIEKSHKEIQRLIQMYKSDSKNVNHILLKKYKSYLDWIELVYFNNKEIIDDYLKMKIIKKSDLINQLDKTEEIEAGEGLLERLQNSSAEIDESAIEKLKQILKWNYEFLESSNIPTKSSVTKIKQAENEKIVSIEEIHLDNKESEFSIARPKFLNEEEKLTGAQKGTLMHFCFQKLDEHKDYTKDMIDEMINDFVARNLITTLEAESINRYKLLSYTNSELFKDLKQAKEVHKEEPFYININSNEIFENNTDENILVQGIIDLYYINQNDEIVLVDFKTDFVENGEKELIEKYKKQLELYSRALEQALNKKVSKIYIYSVYLEKNIEIK